MSAERPKRARAKAPAAKSDAAKAMPAKESSKSDLVVVPPGLAAARPPPRQDLAAVYAPIAGPEWRRGATGMPPTPKIPTDLLHFNWMTAWNGLPGGRIVTMHGPTHEGKTRLALAFMRVFVRLGLPVAVVEPELHLERDFVESMWDADLDALPNVFFPPERALLSMRDTAAWLDDYLGKAKALWDAHAWIRTAGGSVGLIDSLDALQSPELVQAALEAFEAESDGLNEALKRVEVEPVRRRRRSEIEVETPADRATKFRKGLGGELAKERKRIEQGNAEMRKAAMNRVFIARLNVLASHARCLILLVTHETKEDITDRDADEKPRGGKAIGLWSSYLIRVTRRVAFWDKEPVGDEYQLAIKKNKLGAIDGYRTLTSSWFSNGTAFPYGLDLARDAIETGMLAGLIIKDGSWFKWPGQGITLGNGIHAACEKLWDERALLDQLRDAIGVREEETRPARRQTRQFEEARLAASGEAATDDST